MVISQKKTILTTVYAQSNFRMFFIPMIVRRFDQKKTGRKAIALWSVFCAVTVPMGSFTRQCQSEFCQGPAIRCCGQRTTTTLPDFCAWPILAR